MVTIHIKVESNIHLTENAVEFKKKLLDQLSKNTKTLFEKTLQDKQVMEQIIIKLLNLKTSMK